MATEKKDEAGKVVLSRIYPSVEKNLKDPAKVRAIDMHIAKVIGSDRITTALEKSHPGEIVYFGSEDNSEDQRLIYETIGVPAVDIRKAVKDTKIVDASWAHTNKPLYWALMMISRYHMLNKNEASEKNAVLFMGIALYAGLQFRYFRRFYQPNIMAYAMNTLGEKFTLRQEGNMLRTILYFAWNSHLKYRDDLRSGKDADLVKYIASMWGRLNGMVKALKGHYEETKNSGAYLNMGKDRHDDGSLVDTESSGTRVMAITDKVTNAFFGEPVPSRIIDISAQLGGVPKQSLALAVTEIRSGDIAPVRDIIRLLTELFFEEEKATQEDIKTRNFLLYANTIYTRSNTIDGRVEKIKEILNDLLAKHSPQFLATNRDATKGAFRKSLYLVIVIFMQSRV